MKKPKYPLEEIITIKGKRLEEAEKMLKHQKEILDEENKKLKECKKKLEDVKKRKIEKVKKHLDLLEKGTTSKEIAIHERYLKQVISEELQVEMKKVNNQEKIVKQSEENVVKARKEYLQKNQDVEKLNLHRKEWDREIEKQEILDESNEGEELNINIHSRKRRQ